MDSLIVCSEFVSVLVEREHACFIVKIVLIFCNVRRSGGLPILKVFRDEFSPFSR